ncbi:PREDICTED: probable E3 ubiquitin-protein ligase makorin-1 [Nanorana parkeri]|uniref:probable E3 ubiquitin-protein ligase makorin-1 n=1 Tax=Nanorana parkeri TaxID=125878 RepID=UPI000853F21F|nr:PREDICTED: probable E3 ubiquitin-protein ligase makorin-1 [Nanorana parkeri]
MRNLLRGCVGSPLVARLAGAHKQPIRRGKETERSRLTGPPPASTQQHQAAFVFEEAMATASSRGAAPRAPCRAFLRGVCRWGANCHFSHERKPAPLCRHFQNGFCGYGDRCSFQHTTAYMPSDASHYHAGRRVSEPCIVSHFSGPPTGRRGSEPSVSHLHTLGSESQTKSVRSSTENWALAAEFIPRNAGLVRSVSSPVLMSKEADSHDETKHQTSMKILDDSERQYERSRDVVCGICMDKVYDKQVAERVFGILPNCSHAYCVECIKRWRKTREFQNEVVKGCPQCRVKSSYFIPHKYWIGDSDEKLKLIENFKAKTGKIRCRFFLQSNGRCPFKSECIYRHELPHGHQRRRRRDPRRASASALSYSHLVGIYEEDFSEEEDIDLLHCALTLALIEDRFELGLGFPEEVEILLGEFSDSDKVDGFS